MILEVEIDGRRRRVELERSPGGWVASLDGRSVPVDAVQIQIGEGWSLLVGAPSARRSYEAVVADGARGAATVYVDGHAIEARVIDPRRFVRRGRDTVAGDAALRPITAPMPGRIVKVLVQPGDHVVARQGLVVVEAMKMENELRAPAEAVVREVRAAEGSSVEAGAVLVVLE